MMKILKFKMSKEDHNFELLAIKTLTLNLGVNLVRDTIKLKNFKIWKVKENKIKFLILFFKTNQKIHSLI